MYKNKHGSGLPQAVLSISHTHKTQSALLSHLVLHGEFSNPP